VNYLTLENVSKTYGEKVLFDNIDLTINKGQKVALIAKNGTGKSTLLRVISGQEAGEGERCKLMMRKGIKLGFLAQDPDFFENHSILEAVFDSDNPIIQAIKNYENALLFPEEVEAMQKALTKMDDLKAWDFEAKVKEILSKFKVGNFNQTIKTLSGGQKKRLALAKLIIDEPDFLILDEPTNHLDLDMIEWLEEYLKLPNLTVLMVTHDRYFLDRVCNQIFELEKGILYRYSGNYSDFLHKKTTRHENEGIEFEKNKKLLKKELEWVNRMPKARGTKAKSRVDAFANLKDKVSGHRIEKEIQIDIKGQRLGKKILECHYISKRFGEMKIVEDFNYKFQKKERVGIVGPNGVGKTTLLKLFTNELRPDGGKVVVGGNTVFGYYTQSGIQLPEDLRVIDVVREIAEYIPLEKGMKLSAAQLLERFMFNRKQQQIFVSQLSGGERRRLYLLTVLMRNPNFLILDEPTNDLDIITLNVLEEFLLEFPGCVVIVTHDRYFMDKLVDHLFVFEGNGQVKDFNGDYSDFRVMQKQRERELRSEERSIQKQEKDARKQNEQKEGLSFEQRKEIKRLENQIAKLEVKKAEITERFNNTGLTPEEIEKYGKELNEVNESIEEKELLWMELAENA